jgi:hypothetical protein
MLEFKRVMFPVEHTFWASKGDAHTVSCGSPTGRPQHLVSCLRSSRTKCRPASEPLPLGCGMFVRLKGSEHTAGLRRRL